MKRSKFRAGWTPALTIAGGVLLGCAGGLSAFEQQSNSLRQVTGVPEDEYRLVFADCAPSQLAVAGNSDGALTGDVTTTDATLRTVCVIDYPDNEVPVALPGSDPGTPRGLRHQPNAVRAF